MRILVRPRQGIRAPEIDKGDPAYLRKRLEWRRLQVDDFWRQLANELALTGHARTLAEQKMVRLPAVGMLVIDDSIATMQRLQAVGWVIAYPERSLPRPILPIPMSVAGSTATPWHLTTIKKPVTLNGKHVSIGVIDFGCDTSYADLATFAPTFMRYDDATGGLIKDSPSDGSGATAHGSKVCSLLAGSTNGVAPKANYLVAGVIAPDYETTQITMALAFEWLLSENTGAHPDRAVGCDIITTSLHTNGYAVPDSGDVEDFLIAAEEASTLIVAAVGNGGVNNWQPPGSFSTVLAVGAVDVNRDVAWFSADGKPTSVVNKPDLLAPGYALEWPLAGGKDLGEGTSFAAPIVAGAAALILENQPILRKDVVKFRNEVLRFVSNSNLPATIRQGKGICDLNGL